jgi:hypothetical protein
MRQHCLPAIAVLLTCAPVPLAADDVMPVAPGTRVRVRALSQPDRVTGRVVALDHETLTLEIAGRTLPLTLPRREITAMDVSAGRRSRARHALIGAAVGAALGLVAARTTSDSGNPYLDAQAGAAGTLLLASAGALVGVAIPPGERWRSVAPGRIRSAADPHTARRVGVSASVWF